MNVSAEEIDALRELINIGVGRAAGALNDMVGAHVELRVPSVRLVSTADIGEIIRSIEEKTLAAVRLGFSGEIEGTAELVFPADSASKLVALLTGEELGAPDLDSLRAGTLTEVGNILLNGVMGSITNVLEQRISYQLPTYSEETPEDLFRAVRSQADGAVLLAKTQFLVAQSHFSLEQEKIEGEVTLLFGMGSFQSLVKRIHQMHEELCV